jgi:hypothetical protein
MPVSHGGHSGTVNDVSSEVELENSLTRDSANLKPEPESRILEPSALSLPVSVSASAEPGTKFRAGKGGYHYPVSDGLVSQFQPECQCPWQYSTRTVARR